MGSLVSQDRLLDYVIFYHDFLKILISPKAMGHRVQYRVAIKGERRTKTLSYLFLQVFNIHKYGPGVVLAKTAVLENPPYPKCA